MVEWWGILLIAIGSALVGAIITFFVVKHLFQKQIKENPPVNREQIKQMYMSMGRKPSEAQINQTMKAFQNSASKPNKK